MSTLMDAVRRIKAPRVYYIVALGIVALWAVIAIPNLNRSRSAAELASSIARQRPFENEISGRAYAPIALKPEAATYVQKEGIGDSQLTMPDDAPDATAGRRIVRSASIEMIVEHPAEVADQITVLAEKLGGYLISADGAGQNATLTTVTVFVPVAHFEEARTEIRRIGLRVENEKFEARDVTQQYVDQQATIRNLQAQELQYLEILKQANNVPNMMGVTEKLSEVRGKIEKEQAEFNSLAQQVETVAIAVSLRTEREQQVFGIDWRPLYELKVAASNGLESVATYATAMMTILFYLPAVFLWMGTIFISVVFGWRAVQWARRRWLALTAAQNPIQG
jgi:hypothetical protein